MSAGKFHQHLITNISEIHPLAHQQQSLLSPTYSAGSIRSPHRSRHDVDSSYTASKDVPENTLALAPCTKAHDHAAGSKKQMVVVSWRKTKFATSVSPLLALWYTGVASRLHRIFTLRRVWKTRLSRLQALEKNLGSRVHYPRPLGLLLPAIP